MKVDGPVVGSPVSSADNRHFTSLSGENFTDERGLRVPVAASSASAAPPTRTARHAASVQIVVCFMPHPLRPSSRHRQRMTLRALIQSRAPAAEAGFARADDRLGASADPKFPENGGDVIAGGLLAHAQPLRNSGIVDALRDELQHLKLTAGELADVRAGGWALRKERVERSDHLLPGRLGLERNMVAAIERHSSNGTRSSCRECSTRTGHRTRAAISPGLVW